ncbi:flagellar basal body rod protein FlgB [Sulfurospirillum sp. 1612]|uniref:flagellar basal body rod protein FlgB n=1 Tax=Sulfurospirillum sp. 1612 TaxID=3094835 RepID=UPI002F95061A
MSFEISKSFGLMEQGLNARALRQEMIAGNIANIDTPNYKARDIDFEASLAHSAQKLYGAHQVAQLKMAQTNQKHLSGYHDSDISKPTIYLRDGHTQRNDGNTVDLDIETTELGKNNMMFNALSAALKKDSTIFKSVIEASSRV